MTGDTKVVECGKADGVYINTSGIGVYEGIKKGTKKSLQFSPFSGSLNVKGEFLFPYRCASRLRGRAAYLKPQSENRCERDVENFISRGWISNDGLLPNEKFIGYA